MILNKDKLLEYFYSNLASVFWSFFLVLGGGVFIAYFARIGYMPDFDLKSSVAITAATAVTSIIVISVLLVMTILPGAFWSGIWSNLGDISKLNKYWTGSSQGKNFLDCCYGSLSLWSQYMLQHYLIFSGVRLHWHCRVLSCLGSFFISG